MVKNFQPYEFGTSYREKNEGHFEYPLEGPYFVYPSAESKIHEETGKITKMALDALEENQQRIRRGQEPLPNKPTDERDAKEIANIALTIAGYKEEFLEAILFEYMRPTDTRIPMP